MTKGTCGGSRSSSRTPRTTSCSGELTCGDPELSAEEPPTYTQRREDPTAGTLTCCVAVAPYGENSDCRGLNVHSGAMPETLIGYARCSTDEQDLTAQQERLGELGVSPERIYLDHGLTGTNRARPGLDQALAAVREGDTLVVPKLDRLARSVPDARAIGDDLAGRGIKLSLGGQVYDPEDPMGKMFFNILATFAEFEVDLLRMRTREGMAVARAKGKLKGKQPKLSARQRVHVLLLARTGEHTIAELVELFSVSRATIYREIA